MKRQIKLRAWHKAEKRMCEVELYRQEVGAFLKGLQPQPNQLTEIAGKAMEIISPKDGRFCNIDEFDLMEWTGLIDVNGKEIWEGDLVQYTSWKKGDDGWTELSDRNSYKKKVRIEYSTKTPFIGFTIQSKSEVIGNIYEGEFVREEEKINS